MYYYKQLTENGEMIAVSYCDYHLAESSTQVEISEDEYNAIINSLPEPELPDVPEYTITDSEIDAAYQEGVQSA